MPPIAPTPGGHVAKAEPNTSALEGAAGTPQGDLGAKSVLVVGGSIAALEAALDLANGGAEVHLVESGPFLGDGFMQRATLPGF